MKTGQWMDKNKWFIIACVFLGINLLGVLHIGSAHRFGDRKLYAEFKPGANAEVSALAPLIWIYTEPMVSENAAGKELENAPALISPAVEGMWRWADADFLEFVPSVPWPRATDFRVQFPESVKSLSGSRMMSPRSYEFHSEPVRIVSVRQTDWVSGYQALLEITFNQKVSPQALRKYMRLLDNANKELTCSVNGDVVAERIMATVVCGSARNLKIYIRKGFFGEEGPLPIESDLEQSVAIESGLALSSLKVESPSSGDPSATLYFTRPVDMESLPHSLKIEPAVRFAVEERENWWKGKNYVIAGDFTAGRNYTLTLARGLKARDGNARLVDESVLQLFIPDRQADVRIRLQGSYLSPSGSLNLPLTSVNVKEYEVGVTRVFPNNLVHYALREGGHSSFYGQPEEKLGEPITNRKFTVSAGCNEITDHALDLKTLLPEDAHGAFVITLRHNGQTVERRLIVVTDTGIAVKQSEKEILVWANSIHTLGPVTNGKVQVWSEANQLLCEGFTDGEGLALLSLPSGSVPFLVSVAKDNDLSFLSIEDTRLQTFSTEGERPYLAEGYEAFVYSDRGIYRPGETAHIRAVMRGLNLSCPADFPVELRVRRPDGRLHSKKPCALSKVGTAEFEVAWADHDATGSYRLELVAPGSDIVIGNTAVSVEEFVPPRIAVEASMDKTNLIAGESARLLVKGRYLYGSPASGNSASARMEIEPALFSPEQWKDYVFGDEEKSFNRVVKELGSGHLNGAGEGSFDVQADEGMKPPAALRAMLSATVMEQGGRTVSAFTRCRIHAYPFYIGLRGTDLNSLRPGGNANVDLQLVEPGGNNLPESRKLNVSLARITWSSVLEKDRHGKYHYSSARKLIRESEETVETAAKGFVACRISPAGSGEYLLSAKDAGSGVSSSLKFYVGSDHDRWQSRSMEQPGRLELRFDRENYSLGETAILSVAAPFGGKALLTIEQNKVIHREILSMKSNTAEFRIPVTAAFWPNAHASVSVIREVAATGGQDIYRAVGSIPVRLNDRPVRLKVDLKAPRQIRPQTKLDLEIAVRDSGARVHEAEVAVAAIDEGICMLTGFQTPDPVEYFTAIRRNGVEMSDLYSLLMPETDDKLSSQLSHTGGDLARLLRGRLNPVKSRRFKPVALWRGGIMTDSNGMAKISMDIPEFSGALRLMAVAVSCDRFGSASHEVTVNRPFTVLSSLPRFLAPGDHCVMPVELHNATGSAGDAVVEIECSGPVTIRDIGPNKYHLTNGERLALEIPVEAGGGTGVAKIRLKASLGGEEVEEVTELPVRPASAMQTVSGTVAIPAGEQQTIAMPGGWMWGTAQHEIQISGLPAVTLKGGMEYLLNYPYGCLEQTTSASFPLLYLADLVNQPDSPFQVADVSGRMAIGISRIMCMQMADGSFSYWPRCGYKYDWGSIYASHFLVEAQKAGYPVPKAQLDAAIEYLKGMVSDSANSPADLQSAEWRSKSGLRAYACHVLALAGKPEHGWVARLREQAQFLDYDSRLHLIMALAASGMRREAWNDLQAVGSVPSGMERSRGDALSSPACSAALLLNAWMEFNPDHAGIPALVSQVESHMTDGCWYTTQENALSLMALGKYMRHTGKEPRGCAGWMELNGERRIMGAKDIPLRREFLSGEAKISNDGPGTMYCGWMVRGIPAVVSNVCADNGIAIRRTFLTQDQQPADPSETKQGELLVVQWTVNTQGRRLDNLVIEDLLPAGLEIENASLRTSQLVPWANKESSLPVRHMEIRDDRMVVFAGAFEGEAKFCYAVRAVSPGDYALPAVAISAMYDPAVQSIHGAGRIRVAK